MTYSPTETYNTLCSFRLVEKFDLTPKYNKNKKDINKKSPGFVHLVMQPNSPIGAMTSVFFFVKD